MSPFRYELVHQFTEAEYAEARTNLVAARRAPAWKVGVALVLGVAALFSAYTLLLGIAVLVLAGLAMAAPRLVSQSGLQRFRETEHLHTPVCFGVDEEHAWVRAVDFSADLGWSQARSCFVSERWLVIYFRAAMEIVLPVSGLQASGAYRPLLGLLATRKVPVKVVRSRPGASSLPALAT